MKITKATTLTFQYDSDGRLINTAKADDSSLYTPTSTHNISYIMSVGDANTNGMPDSLEAWPIIWRKALQDRFPYDWQQLAEKAGSGIKELLKSDPDLDEAYHTCRYGLLASKPIGLEQLRIAGERLLQDAIEPLAEIKGIQ